MQGEHEAGVLVFAPAVPLNFTNAGRICGDMKSAVAGKQPPVKLLVIEASSMIDIDYTGSQMLLQAVVELRAKGIAIAIARLSGEQAQSQASRSGLLEAIDADHVFLSVEDAVRKLGPNRGG
jgi:SulP family sulfate permease